MSDAVGVAAAAYFVSRQQQQCVSKYQQDDIKIIKVSQRQCQKQQQIQFQTEMTKTRW